MYDPAQSPLKSIFSLKKEKARKRGPLRFFFVLIGDLHVSKIRYDEDVHDLRSIETEFLAIVYNDTLTSELALSCEPTVSPQHIDKLNWKIGISLSDFDDEHYIVIYDNDSFSYKIFNVDDLKLDMGNEDDKIDIEQSSRDLSIELLPNVININVGAYAQGSNKLLETSHDTSSKFSKLKLLSRNYVLIS
ncbi:hypothetical protein Tco_1005845 [Tanacetum coccineum]|uniref:Uncharacterized protein n=1 Tax=Tanacetum coccineum TaxID=301880 RepID=A0ABQ5FGB7_9ASTR